MFFARCFVLLTADEEEEQAEEYCPELVPIEAKQRGGGGGEVWPRR